jgi:hypothetical protein
MSSFQMERELYRIIRGFRNEFYSGAAACQNCVKQMTAHFAPRKNQGRSFAAFANDRIQPTAAESRSATPEGHEIELIERRRRS